MYFMRQTNARLRQQCSRPMRSTHKLNEAASVQGLLLVHGGSATGSTAAPLPMSVIGDERAITEDCEEYTLRDSASLAFQE